VGDQNNNCSAAAKNGNGRAPEIAETVQRIAARIHARHPSNHERRDCSAKRVAKLLESILRHRRIPAAEQEAYMERIDRNHAGMCASETWLAELILQDVAKYGGEEALLVQWARTILKRPEPRRAA
jgi:hypothetical protein